MKGFSREEHEPCALTYTIPRKYSGFDINHMHMHTQMTHGEVGLMEWLVYNREKGLNAG